MEGEEEASDEEGSFSKASIPKRIAIVVAGALVNIIFAIILYFILGIIFGIQSTGDLQKSINFAFEKTGTFVGSTFEGIGKLFTGQIGIDQMTGPVGISGIVAQSSGVFEFFNLLAIISLSLGITNLLPIPALDGGKILILIIEAIRRKPLKQETEVKIQLVGFVFLITLAIFITYKDIVKLM